MREFILKCYAAWIDEHVPKDEIDGNCFLWSRVMAQAFPELILVGSYVKAKKLDEHDKHDFFPAMPFKTLSYHEYLLTDGDDIIDPTAIQFDRMMGKDKWFYVRCEEHLLY